MQQSFAVGTCDKVPGGHWPSTSAADQINKENSSPVLRSPGLSAEPVGTISVGALMVSSLRPTGALPGDLVVCMGPKHSWVVIKDCFPGSCALFVERIGAGGTQVNGFSKRLLPESFFWPFLIWHRNLHRGRTVSSVQVGSHS